MWAHVCLDFMSSISNIYLFICRYKFLLNTILQFTTPHKTQWLCSGRGLAFCWMRHTSVCKWKGWTFLLSQNRLEKMLSCGWLTVNEQVSGNGLVSSHQACLPQQKLSLTTCLVGCCERNAKDWLGDKNWTDCKSSPFRSGLRYRKAALPPLAINLFNGKRLLMHTAVAGTGLGSFLAMLSFQKVKVFPGISWQQSEKTLFLTLHWAVNETKVAGNVAQR